MRILCFVFAAIVSTSAWSQSGPTAFRIFPFTCSTSGPIVLPSEREIVHQVINVQRTRGYVSCNDKPPYWDDGNISGPVGYSCFRVMLSSYDVVCRGGILSAAQVSAQSGKRGQYLSGSTLVLTNAMGRTFPMPPGWGDMSFSKPYSANLDRLLTGKVPVTGSPPGRPYVIDHAMSKMAPVPQILLATLLLPSLVLAFLGSFHNPTGRMHPHRWPFWLLLAVTLGLIAYTANDPNRAISSAFASAHEAMNTINADQQRLAEITGLRDGQIQPTELRKLKSAFQLMTDHRIPETRDLGWHVPITDAAALFAPLLFILLIISYTYAGFYYLFRRPKVLTVVEPALNAGSPIPHQQSLEALRAAKAVPDLTPADDSDVKHLGELAGALARDVSRRGAIPADVPALPTDPEGPEDRHARRWRLIRYIITLIERRERSLAAELDTARHARTKDA